MTAKQVILQRLREVESEHTYGEYAGREGDIVTGIVQQHEQRAGSRVVLVDLGRVRGRAAAHRAGAGGEVRARPAAQVLRRVGAQGTAQLPR